MPWVFLHAIKDYYELPWLLSKTTLKATFNLVPSLLIQLKEYENRFVNDKLFNVLRKSIHEWSDEEKLNTVHMLFSANRATMIAPVHRYAELNFLKEQATDFNEFALSLNEQALLDLSVCFLLAWCGNAVRRQVKLVKDLLNKGRGFSEKELHQLLDSLFDFIATIIPLHKSMQEAGKIEVATTPFYHPILPILLDKNAGIEAYHDCIMPKNLADFKDDAPKHVQNAIKLYKEIFNKPPNGFWPAEGSISKQALSLLVKNGIKWAASDEDVLFKSIRNHDRFEIYKRHIVSTDDGDISVLFRDKRLSDLIGFTYSTKDAKESAKDFIAKLRDIYDNVGFSPLVPIILDGENAWEFYPNNAYDFFMELYEQLMQADWIETVTASEACEADVPVAHISDLQPGSWIYGTFSTWIGQEQKNRAWELLSLTKRFINSIEESLDEKTRAEIEQNLMIAEGSDWFWWYGDDHFTPLASEFDALFRLRLINIFRLGGKVAPTALYEPIVNNELKPKYKKPSTYIFPTINGELSDYYEWLGCGYVELGAELAAMDSSGFILQKLYWGFNETNVYFGLEGKFSTLLDSGYNLVLNFSLPDSFQIVLPFSSNITSKEFIMESGRKISTLSCVDKYFEIELSRHLFENDRIAMVSFEIIKDAQLIERSPRYGALELEIGEKLMDDWFI
ncbi:MAG: hypothetical protein RL154_549 [Pseudomonadota bacterium]